MKRAVPLAALAATLLVALGTSPVHAQARIQCESRDYQYQFCPIPPNASAVYLAEQRSRSACIEGRSWGWDRRGIWVSSGCAGIFDVAIYAPPPVAAPAPGGTMITCESRNYQQQFCPTGPIVGATLVAQRSRAACIQGQTWGFQQNGIWVTGGCEGDFQVASGYVAPAPLPAPTRPGLLVCESRNYAYAVCPAGRITGAQLVRQISQAPCVQGQSWGFHRDAVWVDRGCEGEFEIFYR